MIMIEHQRRIDDRKSMHLKGDRDANESESEGDKRRRKAFQLNVDLNEASSEMKREPILK